MKRTMLLTGLKCFLGIAGILSFCMLYLVTADVASAAEKPVTVDDLIARGSTYVGAETCGDCHEEAARDFKLSTHSRLNIQSDDIDAQGCEMCHGPGQIHVDKDEGEKNTIVNPSKDPSVCFSCHTEKKIEFRLPSHHPVNEGKVTCTDCHSPHGIDASPGKGTAMDSANALCFECHKEKRGPFVMEHEAVREGCTVCHKPHGSIHDKMLIARDWNLCLRCHTQSNFPVFGGDTNHAGRRDDGACYSSGCHTGVHGSNFDDHLRE